MVRFIPSVIHATSAYILISASAQAQGSNPLTGSPIVLGSTSSSTTFVEILTSKYTVDTEGIIEVGEIFVNIVTSNGFNSGTNAVSKYQISGDGGNNFIDLTTGIPSVLPGPPFYGVLATSGRGKWIDNIEVGPDKLQLRVLGKSTDGHPATIAEGGSLAAGFVFPPPVFTTITLIKRPI